MKRQFLIDCDGTLFFNDFPFIEKEVPHAIRVVKRMQEFGHTLILLTMRVDEDLELAKRELTKRDINMDYFNHNPLFETGSRKVYGNWSIDDHNIGIPLIHNHTIHYKPFVDWLAVEKILEDKGFL